MTYNNQNENPTPDELRKLAFYILLYISVIILSNIFSKYGFN